MESKISHILKVLKEELRPLLLTSVGAFLFILFFQPFPLDLLVYNDRLLYVTGFGVIIFLLSLFVLKIIPVLLPKWFKQSDWESGPPIFLNLFLLILNVIAFSFYVRFVGKSSLSLYIMFKVVLICLIPIILLMIIQKNKLLEEILIILREQNNFYLSKIQDYEKNNFEKDIELFSSNKSDRIKLKYKDIVFIKSADNYIEINFLEKEEIKKKLLRNTLKNIEIELEDHRHFIRCHRTCIINTEYIEKLARSYNGYGLKMFYFEEKIPVSRQYLLHIKDAISVDD